MIFLNSASSAAGLVFYLPGLCTHIDTEGNRERNISKSSKKNTILNEHPVFPMIYACIIHIIGKINNVLTLFLRVLGLVGWLVILCKFSSHIPKL